MDENDSIAEAVSTESAEFSEIILKPGHKCRARESPCSPIYLAKILKVRGSGAHTHADSDPADTPSSSKKRRSPQSAKSERTPKRASPTAPPAPAADASDSQHCPGGEQSQPTELFIHFEGWNVKHDRSVGPLAHFLKQNKDALSKQRTNERHHVAPALARASSSSRRPAGPRVPRADSRPAARRAAGGSPCPTSSRARPAARSGPRPPPRASSPPPPPPPRSASPRRLRRPFSSSLDVARIYITLYTAMYTLYFIYFIRFMCFIPYMAKDGCRGAIGERTIRPLLYGRTRRGTRRGTIGEERSGRNEQ